MSSNKRASKVKKPKNDKKHQRASTINYPKLLSAWSIAVASSKLIWKNRGLFAGIALLYGLVSFVLVQGLTMASDASSLKQQFSQVMTGSLSSITTSFSVFMVMLGSTGGSSPTAGVYQSILGIIVSLALIWSVRQLTSTNHKIRVRDAYYQGMTPLIPFVLVMIVLGLQLIPMLVGSSIYSIVIANGIAVNLLEKILWLVIFLGLSLVSLYMVSSSVFALYIVTLPEMTPLKALRSAKNLVNGRRWLIVRKLLFLPLILFFVATIIMLPIILLVSPAAQWVFLLLSVFYLVGVHVYMYKLYQELLRE